ncbi:acyltransferase family protein [Photobacterium rosenbergii]|uniref:acyltransferase family protein n=2 Tax=Photobacterium TaxID=657 RepID=UPI001C9966F1|nr:acyltransferase family protein [Photobacterium rosenbergii]MBY5943687.1 acyltransferase family protein [Photobacterium rosenbergii]
MNTLEFNLQSKDNNFNLIRALAALAVIFSHSFILAEGSVTKGDPISSFFGTVISGLAVDIFFLLSGILVTKSLIDRNSIKVFTISRVFRIFPALLASILFCILIVGPLSTNLGLVEYLFHPETKSFLINNMFLFDRIIQFSLPGVFQDLPYPVAVNGSLWSLPWEVLMYSSILGLFIVSKKHILKLLVAACIIAYAGWGARHIFGIEVISPVSLKLITMFYTGVAFYLLRHKIRMTWLTTAIVVAGYLIVKDMSIAKLIWPATLCYTTLAFAYLLKGAILKYNQLGDYSYGLYIYSFPIQQLLVMYFAPSAWVLFFLSTFLTTVCAMLSWRYIEKPCMRLKNTFLPSSKTVKESEPINLVDQLKAENKELRNEVEALKMELELNKQ